MLGERQFLGHIPVKMFHPREAVRGPQGWRRAALRVSVGPPGQCLKRLSQKGYFLANTPPPTSLFPLWRWLPEPHCMDRQWECDPAQRRPLTL